MSSALRADIRRYASKPGGLTLCGSLRLIYGNYGLQALTVYRLGRWLLETRRSWPLWPLAWPLYFVLSRYMRWAFDIRLHLSANIGPGLYVGHFGAIVLQDCRLGAFCSIAQSVRIGAGPSGDGPVIGDRVWIGAHATIVGPCIVGSASTISAGSVVARDVPPQALCMGSPARVVQSQYDNRLLLGWP